MNHETPQIDVSDHALVRYLERAKGLDRDALVAEILTDELVHQIAVLGGTGKFVSEGRRIVVVDYTVRTIYPRAGDPDFEPRRRT
jgi:hypothetical protein